MYFISSVSPRESAPPPSRSWYVWVDYVDDSGRESRHRLAFRHEPTTDEVDAAAEIHLSILNSVQQIGDEQ